MNKFDLSTIAGTRKAIGAATEVVIQPRFGCSESWVRISKVEALAFLAEYSLDDTPRHCEIGTDEFGEVIGGTLYLG